MPRRRSAVQDAGQNFRPAHYAAPPNNFASESIRCDHGSCHFPRLVTPRCLTVMCRCLKLCPDIQWHGSGDTATSSNGSSAIMCRDTFMCTTTKGDSWVDWMLTFWSEKKAGPLIEGCGN